MSNKSTEMNQQSIKFQVKGTKYQGSWYNTLCSLFWPKKADVELVTDGLAPLERLEPLDNRLKKSLKLKKKLIKLLEDNIGSVSGSGTSGPGPKPNVPNPGPGPNHNGPNPGSNPENDNMSLFQLKALLAKALQKEEHEILLFGSPTDETVARIAELKYKIKMLEAKMDQASDQEEH